MHAMLHDDDDNFVVTTAHPFACPCLSIMAHNSSHHLAHKVLQPLIFVGTSKGVQKASQE